MPAVGVRAGAHGIRVVALESGEWEDIIAGIAQVVLLPYAATLAHVGTVAAFVASDGGRTMTGSEVNISCGAILDETVRDAPLCAADVHTRTRPVAATV